MHVSGLRICPSTFSRPGPRVVRFVGKRKHARLMSGHFITIAGCWLQSDSSPVQPVVTLFLSSSSRNRQGPWGRGNTLLHDAAVMNDMMAESFDDRERLFSVRWNIFRVSAQAEGHHR